MSVVADLHGTEPAGMVLFAPQVHRTIQAGPGATTHLMRHGECAFNWDPLKAVTTSAHRARAI